MTLELIRRFKWNCRLLMKRADSSIPVENSFIILCGGIETLFISNSRLFYFSIGSIPRSMRVHELIFHLPSFFQFFFFLSFFLCIHRERTIKLISFIKISLLSDTLKKKKKMYR